MQVTCLVTTLHPFQWRPIASYSCPFAVASKDGLLPNPKTAYALQRPLRSRGFRLSDYYMRKTLSQPPKLIVVATNVNIGSGNYNEDDRGPSTIDGKAKEKNLVDLTQPSDKNTASLQAAGVTALLIVFATVAAVIAILSSGGPTALLTAISKSGFFAAFALIFVSEIGDKTFFIAALLAMRHSRGLVLLGASGALALMTIISVIMGRVFQSVPAQLQTTLPVGEYAAVALLLLFGARSIKSAWDLPSAVDTEENVTDETGELAEAQEFLKKSEAEKKLSTPLAILGESFSLVFMAEWGDRSMLATIALGAAQSPFGVASGAIVGHVLATWLAVLGGAFLAKYISEKVVGYISGVLFVVFAAATLVGAF
ncbi:hypothetical protein O6H91_13G041000 [Diphasiastrum complanatum]|uniref:Uncharacterized protein n=1 Tax=Diphasiastrum complanatum TaxID=34168 RepID=A0ACC2BU12_DIPCM|nr:hypothetical protein O6H91_13G041000 [Diphasiastrum complanatum]